MLATANQTTYPSYGEIHRFASNPNCCVREIGANSKVEVVIAKNLQEIIRKKQIIGIPNGSKYEIFLISEMNYELYTKT